MRLKAWILVIFILIPSFVLAQNIGTIADTPAAGHMSLHFSYENLSRKYEFGSFLEKVPQDIFKGTLNYSPSPWINVYGFIGSSNFSNSFANTQRQLYYGGGIKFMLVGGDVTLEGFRPDLIRIRGGIGLDIQVNRLQSRDGTDYNSFDLTEYQGAIDFGLRIFMVTSYFGFKLSWVDGNLKYPDETILDISRRGLFSSFFGLNIILTKYLAFTSELSIFAKRSWAVGLRVTI